MKRIFSTLMIISVISSLISCSKPLSGTSVKENTSKDTSVKENTSEEYMITELRELVEKLRKRRRGLYSYIYIGDIEDELVKIYIGKVLNIVSFLDVYAEDFAQDDLELFLVKTGRDRGTVEYYDSTTPSSPKKIFSISGDLYSAETTRY